MRRARLAAAGLGIGALLWWGAPRGEALAPDPPTAPPAEPSAEPRAALRTAPPSEEAPLEPEPRIRFEARAAEVRQACDLDLDLRCEGEACAAFLISPDLDRLGGWLSLVFQSPRFVLSTAARDLGIPPSILPCGPAVEQLVGGSGVLAVELPDGTEIWCAVQGPGEAGGALCDALAAERGHPEAGFGAEGLRRLRFDDRD